VHPAGFVPIPTSIRFVFFDFYNDCFALCTDKKGLPKQYRQAPRFAAHPDSRSREAKVAIL
jgi:hypothetical protein